MIPKGLKEKDTFEDGGRTYRVVKAMEDGNYISEAFEPDKEDELKCQYCGREIKSQLGLQKHEAACLLNPENREKLLETAKKKEIEIEGKTDHEIYDLIQK